MNPIFSRKIIIVHKNGYRTDYTHVTEFNVVFDLTLQMTVLHIRGETLDSFDMCENVVDRLPIKDIHLTMIDWYIPPD